MTYPTFVLASSSSARAALLEKMNIPFIVDPADIDETAYQITPYTQLVKVLAEEKANVVKHRHSNAIILAADTLIVFNNTVIGKPLDATHAFETLKSLQGHTHQVLTGVCLIETRSGKLVSAVETTHVTFKSVSDEIIQKYVETGEPMGKSGSYAIQGSARPLFLEKVVGDESNVIGLPMNLLSTLAKQLELKAFF